MAKLPKMNLFIDAFNSDTSYLTEEELGMYFRLIMYAWTHEATLPKDKDILYNLPKLKNDDLVDKILRLFFTEEDTGYVQKRLKKEYDYAISVSNKASESASSRWTANAMQTHSERNATNTKDYKTITKTKYIYINEFDKFWDLVGNKVSKGQAYKNYQRLEKEWALQPTELAKHYNDYYDAIPDKKFAKQPAFWLSAEKYLDEKPKEYSKEDQDAYVLKSHTEMYAKGHRLPTWSRGYREKLEELANKL